MAIYNTDGTQLDAVYGINGNALDVAYDSDGVVIYESGSDPYEYYKITSIYNKTRNNAQGLDIYGNYMAIYRDSDYAIQLVNMNTWLIEYTISTSLTAHGNDITFSNIFYNNTDVFPLLFVAQGSSNYGLRLNTSNETSETVQVLNAPPTGNTWVTYGTAFNDDGSRYYCLGYNTNNYSDSSGFIFLETWDTSESIENPTRISSITRSWFPCIQGVAYHDGMLWVASGMDDPVKVYALDPTDASIVKTIDLTRTGELEGIGWGYDSTRQKWFCVYGQIYNGITYYRIDFSSVPIS